MTAETPRTYRYAALLNDLHEMQRAFVYAQRKGTLNQAEQAIVRLEHDLTAARTRVAELETGLLDVARRVEALKLPCGENPESPQAIRNGTYMSIAWVARALLSPSPEPKP